METGTLRLVLFSFILSLLFPMFAYTFTSFGSQVAPYDISLDNDLLINAGIILIDGESHNVTFGGSYQEYTITNQTIRIQWVTQILLGDWVRHYRQNWIGQTLGNWFFVELLTPILDQAQGALGVRGMTNITMIQGFDPEFNWTHYSLKENGMDIFLSTIPADNNNMTKAVMETGIVTVTVGTKTIEQEVGFRKFIDWYRGVVSGASNWGLPDFMVWTVRIFSFLMLLSGLLLAKELLPI